MVCYDIINVGFVHFYILMNIVGIIHIVYMLPLVWGRERGALIVTQEK